MGSLQEFIPFAKEMLSQKPNRGLLKVYLVGSVFAVLGTVIGLVETVCYPFSSGEPLDAEMLLMLAKEQPSVKADLQHSVGSQEEEEKKREEEDEEGVHENSVTTKSMTGPTNKGLSQRSLSNRLHAS